MNVKRSLAIGGAFIAVFVGIVSPSGSAAAAPLQPTPARLVAQIPGTGDVAQIADVSSNGQRLLLVTSNPGSVWSVDTGSGAVSRLGGSAIAPWADQSPSGSFTAWIPRTSLLACPRVAYVQAASAGARSSRVALPAAYAHSSMDAIAVADDGALTVGVSRCHDPISHEALMTVRPGAARLIVRASYAGGTPQQWQISPNGRVFAGCGTVRRRGRTIAQLSLIDSRSPERVRTAQLSATGVPSCVTSDAGTASMADVRSYSERDSPLEGITIGAGRPRRFSLSSDCGNGTGLDVSSPNGKEVITALYVGRLGCRSQRATIINTANGRARSFRHPFGDLSVASGRLGLNSRFWGPFHFWDPFAPALVQLDTLTGTVGIFDPSNLKESRPLRVLPTPGAHADADISPCFLPSGRVLFVGQAPPKYALTITNASRTAVTTVDTAQTGPIASTSCEAAATSSQVFLSTSAGRIYAVAANTLDGGVLRITSGSLAGAPRTDRRGSGRT